MILNLIYQFQASQNFEGDFLPASYGIVYFFSDDGFVDINLLKELSKTIPEADHDNLTFLHLDDLKQFALRVCQELSKEAVRLISIQDYNIGLDGAKDIDSFKNIFEIYGEFLVNESKRKKNIFNRLFNP